MFRILSFFLFFFFSAQQNIFCSLFEVIGSYHFCSFKNVCGKGKIKLINFEHYSSLIIFTFKVKYWIIRYQQSERYSGSKIEPESFPLTILWTKFDSLRRLADKLLLILHFNILERWVNFYNIKIPLCHMEMHQKLQKRRIRKLAFWSMIHDHFAE